MRDLINPIIKGSPLDDSIVMLAEHITLRDLFAAAALAGQEAHPQYDRNIGEAAELAYKTADLMLAERAKQ